MNGIIFDLQRFAVHDGGGIRSTLFLKGCPLHCPWCQNPEGMGPGIRLWHRSESCIACGACVARCPRKALTRRDGRIAVDHGRCDRCGACVEVCPSGAMEFDGRCVTALEAAELLLRDRVFFGAGGGVTLSGGEALAQPEFAGAVLRLCKQAGVDTAVETCLLAPASTVRAMLPVADHFLADLKYLDSETHRKVLGAPNGPILANYEFLVQSGADVLVRTPLIPGYTATEENLRDIASYVCGVDPMQRMELLNFNPLCRSKYASMGRTYPIAASAYSEAELARFEAVVRQAGIVNLVKE